MSFKQRLKLYLKVLSIKIFMLTIRVVVTSFDAMYRLGLWLGPRLRRGAAKLIDLQRKVNRADVNSTTTDSVES